jgi:hypothetical protein
MIAVLSHEYFDNYMVYVPENKYSFALPLVFLVLHFSLSSFSMSLSLALSLIFLHMEVA